MGIKEPLSDEIVTREQNASNNSGEQKLDGLREMLFALKAAKAEFLDIKRNAQNPYLGNRYATLGQVLEAVEPALSKHNFIIEHGLDYRDGKTFLTTNIVHIPSLQNISTEIELYYKSGDMQSLGSAITYARRYSLLVLLGLAMEDDDGNKAKEDGVEKLQSQKHNNPFQRR